MFLNSLRINLKNIYYAYYILNFKVINILFTLKFNFLKYLNLLT